jgi:hypothetical protein
MLEMCLRAEQTSSFKPKAPAVIRVNLRPEA